MPKAFDKVWHNRLLHKRKATGIDGKLLVLSYWAPIYSGVPQGSVLGPLSFLIFMNDLETGIISQINFFLTEYFFADDTSLYSVVRDPEVVALELNQYLQVISNWEKQWKTNFNPDPTKPAEDTNILN